MKTLLFVRDFFKLKTKNTESGFTLLEAIVSLIFIVLLFSLIMSVYDVGLSKSTYVENDSKLINFENDLSSWLEKDYRENNISEIKIGDKSNHLVFVLTDGSRIEYEQRVKGYYRNLGGKSVLLTENKIKNIEFKDNNVIEFQYYLKGNAELKNLKIKLYK